MSFLDDARAFLGVDSTPGQGARGAAEFAGELARRAGLHVEYAHEVRGDVNEANVIARPAAGRPAREFLLQSHLDTAPTGHFGLWTKTRANPFDASLYGDTLYGLGAADAKLDFLCKLEAARGFVGRDFTLPFALVGTHGGQRGMAGAVSLIRRKQVNAACALVGEPTELRLVHAGAGFATVQITIPFSDDERRYRGDHDLLESTSSQGRVFHGTAHADALTLSLDYLEQLPAGLALMDLDAGQDARATPTQSALEIDTVAGFRDPILPKIVFVHRAVKALARQMTESRAEGFEPAHPTAHLSVARTNQDGVTLTGVCRLPPGISEATYEGWMHELAAACASRGATFSVKEHRGGFETDATRGFVKGAQDILAGMGLDSRLRKQAVTSEANVFSRLGIECVVFGPGRGAGNSHRPNEHVGLNDLNTAIAFYRRMIERFC